MFSWLKKWFGSGTAEDWRNPFWRWTESHRIQVRTATYLYDHRFGFKRNRKWVWSAHRDCRDAETKRWTAGRDANFYNGIFTVNRVRIEDKESKIHYRFNMASRFSRNYFFGFGFGFLPDRGEWGWTGPWVYGYKSQVDHNPGVIAEGWEEGAT